MQVTGVQRAQECAPAAARTVAGNAVLVMLTVTMLVEVASAATAAAAIGCQVWSWLYSS